MKKRGGDKKDEVTTSSLSLTWAWKRKGRGGRDVEVVELPGVSAYYAVATTSQLEEEKEEEKKGKEALFSAAMMLDHVHLRSKAIKGGRKGKGGREKRDDESTGVD